MVASNLSAIFETNVPHSPVTLILNDRSNLWFNPDQKASTISRAYSSKKIGCDSLEASPFLLTHITISTTAKE
ncbi:hypothetical protein NQZ68_035914 [Dissostichus eleginoides]|nr:hypothetical protein NQZ68_035914 [Dissostichus eleginoides]